MSASNRTPRGDLLNHPNSHQSRLVPDSPSSIFPDGIRRSQITCDRHSHGRPQTAKDIGQRAITRKASRTHWTLFDPGRLTEASDTSDDNPNGIDNALTLDQTAREAKFVPTITLLNRTFEPTRVTTLTMTESTAYMHHGRSAWTMRGCNTHHLPCLTGTSSCDSSPDPAYSA